MERSPHDTIEGSVVRQRTCLAAGVTSAMLAVGLAACGDTSDSEGDANDGARTVEVLPEAEAAYKAEIDRMTAGTVWVSGGCKSWYIDRSGHNSTLWPTYTWPFRQRLRDFDVAAYALEDETAPEPEQPLAAAA